MPQRFVRQPDGKLAVFSTVADTFVASGLTPDDAHRHAMLPNDRAREGMGLVASEAAAKVARGVHDEPIYGSEPPRQDKLFRWQDSLDTIMRVHGPDHLQEILGEMGFDADAPENQPSPGVKPWPTEAEEIKS